MATYKVLQDIEAEDKLFGPFTLKQFIFGGITVVIGFIVFRILLLGLPIYITIPIVLLFLPFFLLFGFLAAPIGRDQSSETWLLARLRFLFKPRTRIWSQDGIKELVTITAPKVVEKVYTDNFTQDEVRSRLKALANTVDSRGWAVKNVNTNLFNQPDYIQNSAMNSDRLIDPSAIPQEVPSIDVLPSDDILDPINNPTAQHFDSLINEASASYKKLVRQNMQASTNSTPINENQTPDDYYFMNDGVDTSSVPSDYSTFTNRSVVSPGTSNSVINVEETAEEKEIAHRISERAKESKEFLTGHGNVVQPLHDKEGNLIQNNPQVSTQDQNHQADTVQNTPDPDIIGLAYRNDLYIDTTARQAQKIKESKSAGDDEVVISLH